METIRDTHWNRTKEFIELSRGIEGPETKLFSLQKFPGITIAKFVVSEETPAILQARMQETRTTIGRLPLVWVLCNAGGYRSPLIANYLVEEDLSSVSMANKDAHLVIGSGRNYLDNAGISFSEEGIFGNTHDPEPIDILLLNYSFRNGRFGDKATFTRVILMLEQALENSHSTRPLSIIWLEGTEEEFKMSFEDKITYLKDRLENLRRAN